MERKRTPVILDGDPGHDDAIMITMANGSSLFDIKLLSSVNGNQTIEKTTLNMLKIANLLSIYMSVGCVVFTVKPWLA